MAAALDDAGRRPGPRRPQARRSRAPSRSAALCRRRTRTSDCVGVIAWMHTFSPAKMWIAGLAALQKPLLHLHTQFNRDLPWARDRHGLHEPEPVGARRPRVRVHRDAAAAAAQDGRRPLARPGRRRRGSAPGRAPPAAGTRRRRSRSPASATTCARSRSPRATRSRRRSGSASRSTATASAISWTRCADVSDAAVDALVDEYERRVRARAGSPDGRRSPRVAARRRADRGRPARCSSRRAASGRSPTPSRTSDGLPQLPGIAVQRLMADGYGFGAEGDWKTAALVRITKVMSAGLARRHVVHGGLHVPPGARRARRCSARTCSRSARRSPPSRPSLRDPPALDRRQGRSGAARLHGARPGPAVVVGLLDLGDRFRLVAERGRRGRARTRTCRGCRSRGRSGSRSPTSRPPPRRGCSPAARTTRASARRSDTDVFADLAEIAGIELLVDRRGDAHARLQEGAALEPGVLPPRARAVGGSGGHSVPGEVAAEPVERAGTPGRSQRPPRRSSLLTGQKSVEFDPFVPDESPEPLPESPPEPPPEPS